jgi:tetratricopeptide (TPR) repeat protein
MATEGGNATMFISIIRKTVCACIVLLAGGAVVAQPDALNEQVAQFRAALERGDYAAADTALAAALQTSEAMNGPATAQLAHALATIRLDLGKPAEAHAPAVRALELARANPNLGVDPISAELWVARAEAAMNRPEATARLSAALAQAQGRPDLARFLYPAAVSLGGALFQQGDYNGAIQAWTTVESIADTAPSPVVARAQALNAKAASTFLGGVDRTKGSAGEVRDRALTVRDMLEAAKRLLRARVEEDQGDIPLDLARQVYAETLAWESVFNRKIQADNITIPAKDENAREFEYSAVNKDQRLCDVRFNTDPAPVFVQTGAQSGNMGAAVVEFDLDDRGRTTDRRILVSIPPNGTYAQAIGKVYENWFAASSVSRRCAAQKRVYWTGSFLVN